MKKILSLAAFIFSGYTVADYQELSLLFQGEYSDNFVHRWGIQRIAHHFFDPRLEAFPTDPSAIATFNPKSVKQGDIIFVRDVCRFMNEVHPEIDRPYIMVTAGDYKDKMQPEFIDFLDDDMIIAWFCVHPCIRKHPKYHWLPLGIFQAKEFDDKKHDLTMLLSYWRKQPKEKLLCCNFGLRPKFKPERNGIFDLFEKADFCSKLERRPFLEYMKEMSEYKFTLSPRGLGPDCYRTWEAMLVGCIPVLHTCYLDELYADLPVLFVEKWEDVTPEFLEQKYQEIMSKKYNIEKLFMEYWWHKIRQVRDDYLEKHTEPVQYSFFSLFWRYQ